MGWLTMDSPELDLDLLYWNGTMWVVVMVSSGEQSSLSASYEGEAGSYAWRIRCDNCSDAMVMYSLTFILPPAVQSEAGGGGTTPASSNSVCSRCSGCCACSTAHVCYQCGPADDIITNYQCYPDATVAVPAAAAIAAGVILVLLAWNVVKYLKLKHSPQDQTAYAEMKRARTAAGVMLAVGAAVFLTLAVVWHPVVGVDTGCTDCVTMDHAFWALFAVNAVGVFVVAFMMHSDKRKDGPQEQGDQHYVSLTN